MRSDGPYWIGRLARSTEGWVLLAADGRYRLAGASVPSGWDEGDALVWGALDGDSITVSRIQEMMSARQLAEAALFVVRTHGRGAFDHARSRLDQARDSGDVRNAEIWDAILRHITGTRLDNGHEPTGLQNRI